MDEQSVIKAEDESKTALQDVRETVARVESVCWAMNRMLLGLVDERKNEIMLKKKELLGLAGVFLELITDLEGLEVTFDPA